MSILMTFLKVDFYKERKTQELWWHSPKLEQKLEQLPEIKDNPVLFTAFQLHEINKDIQDSIRKHQLNVLNINYEDFTQNPEQTLSKVMNYCGLPADDDCLKFLQETNIEDRNKANTDYFDQYTLDKIQDLQTKLNQLDEY